MNLLHTLKINIAINRCGDGTHSGIELCSPYVLAE